MNWLENFDHKELFVVHAMLLNRTGDIATDDQGFRAALANANRADVFVSIHANSAAHGTEVLLSRQ